MHSFIHRDHDFRSLGVKLWLASTTEFNDCNAWNHRNLSAPYWRIYHNTQKGGFLKTSHRVYAMSPAFVYIIPPNTPYQGWLENPLSHFYVHFTIIPNFQGEEGVIYTTKIDPIIKGFIPKKNSRIPSFIEACRLHQLACHILTKLPAERFHEQFPQEAVAFAIRTLKEHLNQPLTNEELALRVRMHPNSLIRLFKKTTGVSPQVFRAQARIEEACRLLHHTSESLEEIALRTGFCDRYHFSRVFNKIRHVSPAAFRRQMQGLFVRKG